MLRKEKTVKVEKKVISNLNKCYAMSELTWKGQHCFLVAAEKTDPCYLFAEDGAITSDVTYAMLWTFRDAEGVQDSLNGEAQYFIFDGDGKQLNRLAGRFFTKPLDHIGNVLFRLNLRPGLRKVQHMDRLCNALKVPRHCVCILPAWLIVVRDDIHVQPPEGSRIPILPLAARSIRERYSREAKCVHGINVLFPFDHERCSSPGQSLDVVERWIYPAPLVFPLVALHMLPEKELAAVCFSHLYLLQERASALIAVNIFCLTA